MNDSALIILHRGLALGGYTAFLVAGASGLAYLYEERQLKLKNPQFLQKMFSSLETLDRTNLWSLWIGLVLFTVGLVYGFLVPEDRLALTDPKVIFSLVTWAAYAVLLWLRSTAVSRGPQIAMLSILCLLLVGFTFLGADLLLGSQHMLFRG